MPTPPPLIPLDRFAPVFEPLRGRSVGFLAMYGSAGDRLLDAAAHRLLEAFEVDHIDLAWRETTSDIADVDNELVAGVDEIVAAGGGNLGGLYPRCRLLREHYLGLGKPMTILPQSITGPGEDLSRFQRVYLRERASLSLFPQGMLAPDLALALAPSESTGSRDFPLGAFLRVGKEALFAGSPLSLADPAQCCESYSDYFALAGRFEKVVTDRLHFAIAAMLVGTQVELLPVAYHKNRAMFETWLKDLGCGWRDDLSRIGYDKQPIEAALGGRLSIKVNLGRAL